MQTAIQLAMDPAAIMIGLMSLSLISLCVAFVLISKDDKNNKRK